MDIIDICLMEFEWNVLMIDEMLMVECKEILFFEKNIFRDDSVMFVDSGS